ncbi:MAG: hypothetical protein AAFU85_21845 [Planctomycetota bacterium]
MVESPLSRFIEHPKRALMVWFAAGLFGLVCLPPAWDEIAASRDQLARSTEELATITRTVKLADAYRNKTATADSKPSLEDEFIDAESAESLRLRVTRLAKQAKCRIRRLTLSDELQRPWTLDSSPYESPGLGADSRFLLESRTQILQRDMECCELWKGSVDCEGQGARFK